MAKEGKEYLQEVVDAIRWIPNAFRIGFGEGKYIFAAVSQDVQTSEYYAVSAIYDSICDLNCKIKYAFEQTLLCSFPETLAEHQPFSMPSAQETIAMYHVENMVFRISILWDLLAQLCNVIYHTGLDVDKIHYNRYFRKYGQGENAIQICKKILAYLSEKDDLSVDVNPWPGNHAYLNDFRNQMTHRVSPNISSISTLGATLRPPVMYVLHRATEDYYTVSSFLCRLVNTYLDEKKNWIPPGFSAIQ